VNSLDKLPGRSDPSAPAQTAPETLASLGATGEAGLSTTAATARLAQVGPNEVPERRDRPIIRFAWTFWGLSAWMLELIVLISFILQKHADLWVALSLLLVNAVLSFVQEQHASTAVAALRARLQIIGRVLRDGTWQSVAARVLGLTSQFAARDSARGRRLCGNDDWHLRLGGTRAAPVWPDNAHHR
jgi:magnesium-transporting ATPase (P-type)